MKLIRFTFLSLIVASGMMVELSAQERGGRGEGQRKEGVRPNVESNQRSQRGNTPNVRVEQSNRGRVENNTPQRDVIRQSDRGNNSRFEHTKVQERRPEVKNVPRTDRREPIKINNSKKHNYSYSKPVKNFDHRSYNSYHYNKVKFYGNNGIYYRHYNNAYVRYMPPVGFRVNALPRGFISINIGAKPYYFYEGVYYERYRHDYRVVEPPMGAIVYGLPHGYERISYYGQYLYEYAGVLYEKIYHRGERVYQVVGYLS